MPTYLKPYVLTAYVAGMVLLVSGNPLLNSVGFFLLAFAAFGTMIWAFFG